MNRFLRRVAWKIGFPFLLALCLPVAFAESFNARDIEDL